MDQDKDIAASFRALSHHNRAKIFRILVDTPDAGDSYSSLQAAASMTDATLTHHLREMERAGLIQRQRRGPQTAYRVAPQSFLKHVAKAHAMAMQSRLSRAVA